MKWFLIFLLTSPQGEREYKEHESNPFTSIYRCFEVGTQFMQVYEPDESEGFVCVNEQTYRKYDVNVNGLDV